MTCRILLYSLTGNTLKVGEGLAWELGAQLHEIETPVPERGFWARVRMSVLTFLSNSGTVYAPDQPWARSDLMILGTPAWSGRASRPMRRWLEAGPELPERVAFLITADTDTCPESVVEDLTKLSGRSPVAVLFVNDADLASGNWMANMQRFLNLCVIRYRQSA